MDFACPSVNTVVVVLLCRKRGITAECGQTPFQVRGAQSRSGFGYEKPVALRLAGPLGQPAAGFSHAHT